MNQLTYFNFLGRFGTAILWPLTTCNRLPFRDLITRERVEFSLRGQFFPKKIVTKYAAISTILKILHRAKAHLKALSILHKKLKWVISIGATVFLLCDLELKKLENVHLRLKSRPGAFYAPPPSKFQNNFFFVKYNPFVVDLAKKTRVMSQKVCWHKKFTFLGDAYLANI